MKYLRLALSLAFFVPACALLFLFGTPESRLPLPVAVIVAGVVGVFFGLVFGGARGGVIGWIYPPGDERRKQDD